MLDETLGITYTPLMDNNKATNSPLILAVQGESASLHAVDPVCDFCHEPHPIGYIIIEPNKVDLGTIFGMPIKDSGEWAVCPVCKGLIDREMWDDLVVRAVESHLAASGMSIEELTARLSGWYGTIRQYYKGEYREERTS